jgi:hypothetical protein
LWVIEDSCKGLPGKTAESASPRRRERPTTALTKAAPAAMMMTFMRMADICTIIQGFGLSGSNPQPQQLPTLLCQIRLDPFVFTPTNSTLFQR